MFNHSTLKCYQRTCCIHYYNKCLKWHPFAQTQAERCCLHSTVTSSTTVCCMPDQPSLRCYCSCSFKCLKIIQSGLLLSCCCKCKTFRLMQILKKYDSLCIDPFPWLASSAVDDWHGTYVSCYTALLKLISYFPGDWRDLLYQYQNIINIEFH